MTEHYSTPPTSATERRQRLLETMRREGGTWDWRRAQQTYDPMPEQRTVRRDLQQLYKSRQLVRVQLGEYEAV
ncbi:valyl-tRNA synthetase [Kitasatospora sp. MAA4]|uniref:hypothetical protein n=1 Tax=Kitasatospora sp. MAA4 TaxID=3035093 RepID=UPI002475B81F|nr:hypothetical protein [Kitasatospora sp. MAA4]MDH6135681.1 valyl-tRNA synthetase [Kitasatospora sp. MAA4]